MVFFSTIQAVFGRSLARSVFAFGTRQLTHRIMLEEVVMGTFLVFPLCAIISFLTIRLLACKCKRPSFFRADLWTTLIITMVGDAFLEILLPSLQCLPLWHPFDDDASSYTEWLLQSWGFHCPVYDPTTSTRPQSSLLLSTDAVGSLLSIRLIFMCCGVYLGESFVPVALTGGIACGKSTVAKLLATNTMNTSSKGGAGASAATSSSSSSAGRKQKKPKSAASSSQTSSSTLLGGGIMASLEVAEEEGSFLIVDADKIGHEILLPPHVLSGEVIIDTSTTENESAAYTVSPKDSVYQTILDTFGDESDQYQSLLDESGLIDRTKLGAIIFSNPSLRRQLNRITHPRILLVMLKQILMGIYCSTIDITCADIPLLFESGQLRHLFGIVICVSCDEQTQLQRLAKRNPELTQQQCLDRIHAQMPLREKEKLADIVIRNDGDIEALSEEVEKVRREVMGRIYGIGMSLLQMLLLVGGSLSLAVSSKLFSSWT